MFRKYPQIPASNFQQPTYIQNKKRKNIAPAGSSKKKVHATGEKLAKNGVRTTQMATNKHSE
jgi:hypothetical protein